MKELNLIEMPSAIMLYSYCFIFISRSINGVGPVSPLAASLAAGISGSIAAAASHTLDTAKCRSQCIVIPKVITNNLHDTSTIYQV